MGKDLFEEKLKVLGWGGKKPRTKVAAPCVRTTHALLPLFPQFLPILQHFKANYYCVSHSKAIYGWIEVYNLVANAHTPQKHSFFLWQQTMAGETATRKRSEHPRHPPYKKIVHDALEQEVRLLLSSRGGKRILENSPSLRQEAAVWKKRSTLSFLLSTFISQRKHRFLLRFPPFLDQKY